jgi:hypothetical protein
VMMENAGRLNPRAERGYVDPNVAARWERQTTL